VTTLTDAPTGVTITEPGVYDIPSDAYHADPVPGGSLSSSSARKLLPPSCPARFRWDLDHPDPTAGKNQFDIGHAAHRLVLGAGAEFHVIDADDYRSKDARTQRDDARASGLTPLLAAEHDQAQAMATALRAHPLAGHLFDPAAGWPEVTLVWRDEPTGIMRRARVDWLPRHQPGRRLIVPDYKTTHSADLDALTRAIQQFGYHQQAAWYLDGIRALGLCGPDGAAFLFVAQEKTPPYLVTVLELDDTALRIGDIKNRRALQVYRHCTETNHWPAYHDGIALLGLPPWAIRDEGEDLL
jgi:hypothetical protein